MKQQVNIIGIADQKMRHDWIHNKHMKAFNFYKDDELKEVDIIIDSPVTFEDAKKDAIRVGSDDLTLPVVSIDNLIKMKKSAGRDIDRFDLEQLKKIKKIRGSK